MFRSCEPSRHPDDRRAGEREVMNEECQKCGSSIVAEEWHPVATVRDDDGDLQVRVFCSRTCRSAWSSDD